MEKMPVMAMLYRRGTQLVTAVLMLAALLTGAAHAEGGRLDTSSREALLTSLDALSRTTSKADFDDMLFALNLMVIDRSGGRPFRPSPVAVAAVSKEVDGMTPAQIIDRASDLDIPPDMEWVDGFYLVGVRPRGKEHTEVIYSQILVASMMGALPGLNLHDNVGADFSDKKLRSNSRKLAGAMSPVLQQCMRALGEVRHGRWDLDDYPDLVSLNQVLDIFADRTRDMDAFIEYRNALTSSFKVFFTSRADRNLCREGFVPWLELPPSGEKARQLCAGFDMLTTCMVELRHEQRLNDGRVDDTPTRDF